MGWRYRRSLRIAPGARLNVTGNGASSVSFGKRGATLNMGRNGIRTTVGLPGSGLSYSRRVSSGASLVPGIALAGLLLLVVSAARGNRFARITLICIGIAILVLFATAALQNTTVTVSPARYSIGTPPPATPVPERDKTPPPSDMISIGCRCALGGLAIGSCGDYHDWGECPVRSVDVGKSPTSASRWRKPYDRQGRRKLGNRSGTRAVAKCSGGCIGLCLRFAE